MHHPQLSYLFIVLLAALGLLVSVQVARGDTALDISRSNTPGVQAATTATLPPAMATAVPTPAPAPAIIGEGPSMTFMIALLVIAGGAVLLWRRQRSG